MLLTTNSWEALESGSPLVACTSIPLALTNVRSRVAGCAAATSEQAATRVKMNGNIAA